MGSGRAGLERPLRRPEALAHLGRLAAVMAHEIRNPLAAMRQAIGLLGANPALGADDRELISLLVEEIERVGRIATDFLALARPTAARCVRMALQPLIESAAALLRREPRLAEGVAVETSVPPGLPEVALDADRIRQVLWNLGLNAADAAPAHGRIRFAATPMDDAGRPGVSITVTDTGPGVPAARRELVFEAFETRRAGGTGLGLALARGAVAQHGGWIRVDDAPEGGARFHVWLPLETGASRAAEQKVGPWRDS